MPALATRAVLFLRVSDSCTRAQTLPEKVVARRGRQQMPAAETDELHEIKSSLILQPGAAASPTGQKLKTIIAANWINNHGKLG